MMDYVNKKGKLVGISTNKWDEKSFRMKVTRGGVGICGIKDVGGIIERLLSMTLL